MCIRDRRVSEALELSAQLHVDGVSTAGFILNKAPKIVLNPSDIDTLPNGITQSLEIQHQFERYLQWPRLEAELNQITPTYSLPYAHDPHDRVCSILATLFETPTTPSLDAYQLPVDAVRPTQEKAQFKSIENQVVPLLSLIHISEPTRPY